MEPDLHFVSDTAITAVNLVKSKALQSRLDNFVRRLALGTTLLYHTEVLWLSHGKICSVCLSYR